MVGGITVIVAGVSCEGLTGVAVAGVGRLVSVGRAAVAALQPVSHKKEKINQGIIRGKPVHLLKFVWGYFMESRRGGRGGYYCEKWVDSCL
jgi:hypothetical protein